MMIDGVYHKFPGQTRSAVIKFDREPPKPTHLSGVWCNLVRMQAYITPKPPRHSRLTAAAVHCIRPRLGSCNPT